jgi:hypothetical protein
MAKKKAAKNASKKARSKKSAKKASRERDPSQMFRNTPSATLGGVMELVYDNDATLQTVKEELEMMVDALESLINEYGEDTTLDAYNDAAEAQDAKASRRDEAARKESKKAKKR